MRLLRGPQPLRADCAVRTCQAGSRAYPDGLPAVRVLSNDRHHGSALPQSDIYARGPCALTSGTRHPGPPTIPCPGTQLPTAPFVAWLSQTVWAARVRAAQSRLPLAPGLISQTEVDRTTTHRGSRPANRHQSEPPPAGPESVPEPRRRASSGADPSWSVALAPQGSRFV